MAVKDLIGGLAAETLRQEQETHDATMESVSPQERAEIDSMMAHVVPDDPKHDTTLPDLVAAASDPTVFATVLSDAYELGRDHEEQGLAPLSSFAACKRLMSRWLAAQREAVYATYVAGRVSVPAWRCAPGKGAFAVETAVAVERPHVLLRVTHTALFGPGSDKERLRRAIVSVTLPGVGVARHANRVEVEDVEVDVDEGGDER